MYIIEYEGQTEVMEYDDQGSAVADAKHVAEKTGKQVRVYQLVRIVRTETKVVVENPPPPPPRAAPEDRHGMGSQS